jgi:hypothetical protein
MQRYNNLMVKLCSLENIQLADKNARKNKNNYYGIRVYDKDKEANDLKLLEDFKNGTYHTSSYKTFKIYEPKEREIFKLPYYPDRIAHHAIMNVVKEIWTKLFIKNTYSSIEGRGIHAAVKDIKEALKDVEGTKYCLKLDIKKFYPSIDHEILKKIIRKKIKDIEFLRLLDEIIDSPDMQDFESIKKGKSVPIGNYLSQYFANLYLTYFDHHMKEVMGCKYYFRYADDIVILSDSKEFLHKVLEDIKIQLAELKLELKPNYQIFPVADRGIDFIGYKFYHTHVLLRKSIKQRMLKLINKRMSKNKLKTHLQSYFGWCKYCNSKHLLQNVEEKTEIHFSNWLGEKKRLKDILNERIYLVDIAEYSSYYRLNYIYNDKRYTSVCRNKRLLEFLKSWHLPIHFKLHNYVDI